MNYNKSYLEQYDNNHDIIVKKKNIKNNLYNDNNNNNMIVLQNKVEELFLKLKFLNTNKNTSIDINEQNINFNINNSNNIISLINELILKLDTKIICKGQIKRKNNSIEFEF